MGARVYVATMGRFLAVDPIQGGTPNNYVYPTDPVNDFDLTGQFGWKAVANVASFASMLPGPAGMIASGVAAVAYAAAGDKKQAALACAGIALAAVGAGGAVLAYKAAKDAKAITTVARLGQLQKFNAGENRMITGFSKHALGRMAGTRGGPQMSPQAVRYIVAVGKKSYNVKHDSWNYSHWLGSVSLSPQGRIKTVIAKSRYARYIR